MCVRCSSKEYILWSSFYIEWLAVIIFHIPGLPAWHQINWGWLGLRCFILLNRDQHIAGSGGS